MVLPSPSMFPPRSGHRFSPTKGRRQRLGETSCSQTPFALSRLAWLGWAFAPSFSGESGYLRCQVPTSFPMNAVESPKDEELQNLGSEAWDNPAYSGPPSPHGTLRICTISSVVPPQPPATKPEDRPHEKTRRTLVSTCCLQIRRGIRGSWWERVFLGYWSQGKGLPKAFRWGQVI